MTGGSEDVAPSLSTCLIAGGAAGSCVDLTLFPLDTLKTRLQSVQGLQAAGGLGGLYRGIAPTLVGSAPGGTLTGDEIAPAPMLIPGNLAALFFFTYESLKQAGSLIAPDHAHSAPLHILSASMAEVSACTVRVPIEVIKQRMQVHQYRGTLLGAARQLYAGEGLLGFYRGFQATIQREIPFACLQYPLYESLKGWWRGRRGEVKPWQAALCGSVAGGITAVLTTPLDVIKTRIILAPQRSSHVAGAAAAAATNKTANWLLPSSASPWRALGQLWREGGIARLFAGVGPRTLWISLGGFIFFGAYEKAKRILHSQ